MSSSNQKIHHKLKWDTIIFRLNREAGYKKYSNESTGIYEWCEDNKMWFFISSKLCKESFLRAHYDEYYGDK